MDEEDQNLPVMFTLDIDVPKGKLTVVVRDGSNIPAIIAKIIKIGDLPEDMRQPMTHIIHDHIHESM